jgi:lysozyme
MRRIILTGFTLFLICRFGVVLALAESQASANADFSSTDLTEANDNSRGQLFVDHIPEKAIPPDFWFKKDVDFDRANNKARENSFFGIDLSHFDSDSINFALLKEQGVRFVYLKATQGTKFKDPKFVSFMAKIGELPKDAQPPRGAYHFLSAGIDGKLQAQAFITYVSQHGGFQQLPPVVDLEWDVAGGNADRWATATHDPQEIVDTATACLNEIRSRVHRVPILYTATSWLDERKLRPKISSFKDFPLWIADYNPKRKLAEEPSLPEATIKPVLWQFTDRASFQKNIGNKITDASIFYGDLKAFNEAFGLQ